MYLESKKGHNIILNGQPSLSLDEIKRGSLIKLHPCDFPGIKPKLLISEIILSLSILATSNGWAGILFIFSSKSRLDGEIVVIVYPLLMVFVKASDSV